ncbi:hypothetical protein IWZ01DRAFT_90068 [Phyllosticta capitalensis]
MLGSSGPCWGSPSNTIHRSEAFAQLSPRHHRSKFSSSSHQRKLISPDAFPPNSKQISPSRRPSRRPPTVCRTRRLHRCRLSAVCISRQIHFKEDCHNLPLGHCRLSENAPSAVCLVSVGRIVSPCCLPRNFTFLSPSPHRLSSNFPAVRPPIRQPPQRPRRIQCWRLLWDTAVCCRLVSPSSLSSRRQLNLPPLGSAFNPTHPCPAFVAAPIVCCLHRLPCVSVCSSTSAAVGCPLVACCLLLSGSGRFCCLVTNAICLPSTRPFNPTRPPSASSLCSLAACSTGFGTFVWLFAGRHFQSPLS